MTDPTEAISNELNDPIGFLKILASEPHELIHLQSSAWLHSSIRALLDRLDSAERDAKRYRWLRGNVGDISTSAFEDMQFYGEPGDPQDALRLDAAIDAALRAGEQKEPK